MSLTEKDIRKIAKLARIGITDNEVAKLQIELPKILAMANELKEINTEAVAPMSNVSAAELILREDIVNSENNVADILANSLDAEHNCFKVPKVISND